MAEYLSRGDQARLGAQLSKELAICRTFLHVSRLTLESSRTARDSVAEKRKKEREREREQEREREATRRREGNETRHGIVADNNGVEYAGEALACIFLSAGHACCLLRYTLLSRFFTDLRQTAAFLICSYFPSVIA